MTLVIGYGSSLRRDDGAGLAVAEAVAGVERIVVPQLVPELAEAVAAAERVVFVDAAVGGELGCRRLAGGGPELLHDLDPRALLALAARLYGRAPEAWLVTVPAFDLGVGEGLSVEAGALVQQAVALVERIARRVVVDVDVDLDEDGPRGR